MTSNGPGGSGGQHSYLRDGALVGAIAAAIIGALVAVFLKYGPEGNDGGDKAASPPSSVAPLPSADDTTPAPSPSGETGSPSPPDSTDFGAGESSPSGESGGSGSGSSGGSGGSDDEQPPVPGTAYLSDLDPVGGLGNYKHTGTATVQRTTYGNSVIFSMNSFNPGAKTVTYNVPVGVKEFHATVGLDEKTESGCRVFFQVSLDGSPVDKGFTLPVGQTHEVTEKIGNAARLAITVNGVESPSGKTNGTCRAVWGDARLS